MDAIEYSAGVETFKDTEVISALLNISVAATDLEGNISRIRNSDLDLSAVANEWIITKGLGKFLRDNGVRTDDLSQTLLVGVAAIQALVPEVTKLVKGYNEKIWSGKMLTLRQTNILNLIEHLTFWIKFTRMIFDVLLTMNNKDIHADQYLTKYDTRWINGTDRFYRQLTAELLKGSKAVLARLNDVPDIEMTPTTLDVLESTEGADKVDLLKQGFGVHLVNPIFWYHLAWSKINIMRIENMRRDNELFAMKINQAINKKSGGGEDPQLERQIEIYQNEIIKNTVAIEQIEKKYA
jgi:hypothetical protein